ncbi:hypothetical protein QF023_003707 [Chryseobacterium sp. SLBN-27]|nr:hypothetical protein [Chryseobacterium sp. SLBN-27]
MASFSTLPDMRPGLNGVFELFLISAAAKPPKLKKRVVKAGNVRPKLYPPVEKLSKVVIAPSTNMLAPDI